MGYICPPLFQMSRHTFSTSSAITAVLPQWIARFSRPEHKEYTFQRYYYTQCRLLDTYRVFFFFYKRGAFLFRTWVGSNFNPTFYTYTHNNLVSYDRNVKIIKYWWVWTGKSLNMFRFSVLYLVVSRLPTFHIYKFTCFSIHYMAISLQI